MIQQKQQYSEKKAALSRFGINIIDPQYRPHSAGNRLTLCVKTADFHVGTQLNLAPKNFL